MDLETLTKTLQVMRAGMGGDEAVVFKVRLAEDEIAAPPAHVQRGPFGVTVVISNETLAALTDPAGDDFIGAALVLAHAIAHTVGAGPGFVRPEEQFLEEAIAEVLAHEHLAVFVEALGGDPARAEPAPLFVVGDYDLELDRPAAAAASVERFARLAVWLAKLEESEKGDAWADAVMELAIKLKPLDGAARFALLAATGAARAEPLDDAEEDTAETIEEYFRGYLRQLQPSDTGFAALDAALDFAAFGEKPDMQGKAPPPAREDWQRELAQLEGVVMEPRPGRERLEAALEQADEAEPEIAAAVARSLDTRIHLWAARNAETATE